MNIKHKGLWSIIALALAALTIYTVMHGSGMTIEDLLNAVHDGSPLWLGAAVVCMSGYFIFEGMAVRSILKAIGYPRKWRQGLVYGAADVIGFVRHFLIHGCAYD